MKLWNEPQYLRSLHIAHKPISGQSTPLGTWIEHCIPCWHHLFSKWIAGKCSLWQGLVRQCLNELLIDYWLSPKRTMFKNTHISQPITTFSPISMPFFLKFPTRNEWILKYPQLLFLAKKLFFPPKYPPFFSQKTQYSRDFLYVFWRENGKKKRRNVSKTCG